ncbi:MAG: hypothetical protein GY862_37790 [Gammaproteobacteria bacterium]|nr:hypothetical protein [Gammaproteobacteria bacterium]
MIGTGLREILFIFFCFAALYLFISMVTYNPLDNSSNVQEITNKGGMVGAGFADFFFKLFGYFAYLFSIMVAYVGWLIYRGKHHDILAEPRHLIIPGIGFVLTLSAGCGLAIVHFSAESALLLPSHAGGELGRIVGKSLEVIFSQLGATLLLLALFFTGVTLLTGLSWLKLMDLLGYHTLRLIPIFTAYTRIHAGPFLKRSLRNLLHGLKFFFAGVQNIFGRLAGGLRTKIRNKSLRRPQAEEKLDEAKLDEAKLDEAKLDEAKLDEEKLDEEKFGEEESDGFFPYPHKSQSRPGAETTEAPPPAGAVAAQKDFIHTGPQISESSKPESLPLESNGEAGFSRAEAQIPKSSEAESRDLGEFKQEMPPAGAQADIAADPVSRQVQETLRNIDTEARVKAAWRGPVLTRVEIKPGKEKLSQIIALSNRLLAALDLPGACAVKSAPGMICLEIPNSEPERISLNELFTVNAYLDSRSPLTIALGKDISGHPVVVDLARMPHLLAAGNTSADIDRMVNGVLLSLLNKSGNDEMRLIIIDSRRRPLLAYAGVPHLLTPLITTEAKTAQALRWCVTEMERRYRLMAGLGVRNIDGYNQKIRDLALQEMEDGVPSELTAISYLVLVIHELAEVTNGEAGRQIEELITRLAQKARASGIHMVLASQQPSVNVITGLMKTNFPTRIAFRVNSKNESRNILGQSGAENLLGNGDMFYLTPGTGIPARIHGVEVTLEEVRNHTEVLRKTGVPVYEDLNPF